MIVSWPQIIQRYQERVKSGADLKAMLHLAEDIEHSHYHHGLFAWTSIDDLCVVQTRVEYPYDGPYLRISPQFNRTIDFRSVDTFFRAKQWQQTVQEYDAFARLEKFFEQLNWFG